MPDVEIPFELPNILRNFTLSILRTKPVDIIDYAVEYFIQLQRQRRSESLTITNATPSIDHHGKHRTAEGKLNLWSIYEVNVVEDIPLEKIDIRSLMIDKNRFLHSSSHDSFPSKEDEEDEEKTEQIVDQCLRDREKCACATVETRRTMREFFYFGNCSVKRAHRSFEFKSTVIRLIQWDWRLWDKKPPTGNRSDQDRWKRLKILFPVFVALRELLFEEWEWVGEGKSSFHSFTRSFIDSTMNEPNRNNNSNNNNTTTSSSINSTATITINCISPASSSADGTDSNEEAEKDDVLGNDDLMRVRFRSHFSHFFHLLFSLLYHLASLC